MEIEQYTLEQLLSQRRNLKKNGKYLKANENEGKFVMINKYIKKEERSRINNPNLHFKELQKEQTKLKVCRRKKITKNRNK